MKKLLAADIGGSKTRIRLLDTDGTILSESVGTGVAGISDSTDPLPPLEDQLAALPDKESICAAAVNLGGRNTEQVRLSFRRFFPDIPLQIFRESEGTAAYALGQEYDASVVLMAGTGAIAVGKWNRHFVITGGWGIHIGDDGSGYDIGLQAIRLSLRAMDNIEALSPLTAFLCGWETPLPVSSDPALFRDRRDHIRERLAPLDRQHIASLTKIVAEFAEKGDKNALDIFRYAGEKLAELVVCNAKKLTENTIPAVVVTGGLIHIRKFWADSFESRIHHSLPDTEIQYVTDGILQGTSSIVKDLYENHGGTDKL